ncbi:MAG: DUF1549 and DUF1553 domain-containing protein [Verrucomicrobia bacterium]|nr:DUF1549 and DUF1553 domain-containing protein [Verrucomicrobiota bacterium]MDA1004938.1 DUF1549 and DUF1553 domain-containing protein [Verrucomicrobiota bacterium]
MSPAPRTIALVLGTTLVLAPVSGAAPPVGGKGAPRASDMQERAKAHWCWQPIAAPDPPEVENTAWPLNSIDHFILAGIEQAGLRPAFPAPKEIWLRRVYLDLVGLPPTPDQITDFLADESADPYRSVVERLLDSPRFGETWARHWLDLVRYCETSGHENNYPIENAFQYRDYVIRALNADVPYDQFVREHIAGDLLTAPRRHPTADFNESVIGTGFWYFHQSAPFPPDSLDNEANIIDNQIDVFGKAFLGLTVACARCHDHKSDAISTKDYYALSAYLRSSCRQTALLDPGHTIELINDKIEERLEMARNSMRAIKPGFLPQPSPARYHEVAMKLRDRAEAEDKPEAAKAEWIEAAAGEADLDRARLERWVRHAGKFTASRNPLREDADAVLYQDFSAWPTGWNASGSAFEAVTEPILSADGALLKPGTISSRRLGPKQQGTLRSPTFEITTSKIHVLMRATRNIRLQLVIDSYQLARYRALLFEGTVLQDKDADTHGQWAWKSFGRDLHKYIGHKAHLEFIDDGDGSIEIDEIWFSDHGVPEANPTETPNPSVADQWNRSVESLRAGRIDPFLGTLLEEQLVSVAELSPEAAAALAEAGKLAGEVPAPQPVLAITQGTPTMAAVSIRGDHTTPGELVSARFLEALGGEEGGRLDLAEAVANADNPLTTRVIVNRLWHHLLGRGIVPTTDDFGPQGEPSSHPGLLDWLAADFIRQGWSLKHAISQIVLSQTYRQQSVAHPELDPELIARMDPDNILLHRMPVRRMTSETLRDSILFVSGRLDPGMFGPSVSVHVTPFMVDCEQPKDVGPVDGAGRRSIYQKVDRNFLNPLMLAFDMPVPFGSQGRRSQSNVPAQALALLNDPFVIGQASQWADRMLAIPEMGDRERAATMMREAHGVPPTVAQAAAMEEFLTRQSDQYGARDRRAWADLAHALLNMKAFSYIR